jgi:hypothetical protein
MLTTGVSCALGAAVYCIKASPIYKKKLSHKEMSKGKGQEFIKSIPQKTYSHEKVTFDIRSNYLMFFSEVVLYTVDIFNFYVVKYMIYKSFILNFVNFIILWYFLIRLYTYISK